MDVNELPDGLEGLDLRPVSGEAAAAGTLGQRVYRELHQQLLSGRLLPGTKLTLRGLAQALGTSMQPVREAVGRLAAESALELSPNRMIKVPELGRAQLDDLWSLRVLLEGEAAARFAARGTTEAADELARLNDAIRAVRFGPDVPQMLDAVQRWALAIAAGCGSPLLEGMIVNLRLRSGPHFAQALGTPAPVDDAFLDFSLHIQDELVLAIRERDPTRARDLRRADLLTYQRYLYRRLGWD